MKHLFLLISFLTYTQLSAQTTGKFDGHISVQNIHRLNSTQLDFSPAFYQNGIVFVSNRVDNRTTVKRKVKDQNINDFYMGLYQSVKGEEGQMSLPTPFSLHITARFHEGPVSFSRDGQQLYYSQNTLVKDLKKENGIGLRRFKILSAKRNGESWTNIRTMPFCSDDFDDFHPTISADGKTLIFASKRPGGLGGSDLYKSQLIDNQWSTPENLGPSINTSENDAFPFLQEDGTLFFASKGWEGQGGYDIFYTNRNQAEPTNPGIPINSEKDDFGLIMNKEDKEGYFTSSRLNGQGKDDIYQFMVHPATFTKKEPTALAADICLYDKDTEERIPNALIKVLKKRADGSLASLSGDRLMIFDPNNMGRDDLVKTELPVDQKNYENKYYKTDENGSLQTDLMPNEDYVLIIQSSDYQVLQKSLSTKNSTDPNALSFCIPLTKKVAAISSVPKPSSCFILEGTTRYNGTGAILPNVELNLTNNCTGESYRTYSNMQGTFNFACQPDNCTYTLVSSKPSYGEVSETLDQQYFNKAKDGIKHVVNLSNPAPSYSTTSTTVPAPNSIFENNNQALDVGTSLVLEDLYYDFNDYHILPEAARVLDNLVVFMRQYPSMEIELSAHTDSRGQEANNQRLSRKRAEYAVRYLTQKGISADRLQSQGYGESRLRNGCFDGVPCSYAEHRYNRRTEIKIISLSDSDRLGN